MKSITETLCEQHSYCDKIFAQTEDSVAKTQWEAADIEFSDFRADIERHFTREEEVLFPSVEEHIGPTGPTQVMRMEHQQMRDVFAQMQDCLTQRDSEQYLGLSETLLILMQQHNAKEEQILYPMSDQVLGEEVPSILNRMFERNRV
ncbi:MAG: hemerythrin domain-containing protein [Candidatus Parabeggiatoa sp. nov. 3]|nr:MAG: hemerythrin domain-containing protein [Gammaproteobacteria bacterium]